MWWGQYWHQCRCRGHLAIQHPASQYLLISVLDWPCHWNFFSFRYGPVPECTVAADCLFVRTSPINLAGESRNWNMFFQDGGQIIKIKEHYQRCQRQKPNSAACCYITGPWLDTNRDYTFLRHYTPTFLLRPCFQTSLFQAFPRSILSMPHVHDMGVAVQVRRSFDDIDTQLAGRDMSWILLLNQGARRQVPQIMLPNGPADRCPGSYYSMGQGTGAADHNTQWAGR